MKREEQEGTFGTDEENIERLLDKLNDEIVDKEGLSRSELREILGWGERKFSRVLHQADALGHVVVKNAKRGADGKVYPTENLQINFSAEELESKEEVVRNLSEAINMLHKEDTEDIRVSMQSVFN